jgi:hypothetical protein
LINPICSTVLQAASSSRGLAMSMARLLARDSATLSRFLLSKKSLGLQNSGIVNMIFFCF